MEYIKMKIHIQRHHKACISLYLILLILVSGSQLLSLITMSRGYANIPAAYLACEDAEPGVACVMTGPQYGACILDTLCTDPEETFVNGCLLCVDECWNGQEGQRCIRPWTGEEGECELQTQCTDRVETSFLECMRCVQLDVKSNEDDQGCFQYSPSSWHSLFLLVCLFIPFFMIRLLRRYI